MRIVRRMLFRFSQSAIANPQSLDLAIATAKIDQRFSLTGVGGFHLPEEDRVITGLDDLHRLAFEMAERFRQDGGTGHPNTDPELAELVAAGHREATREMLVIGRQKIDRKDT